MSGLIEFPQPEVSPPALLAKYYYPQCGHVIEGRWGHSSRQDGTEFDRIILALGAIYLTREACAQRIAYDAQQMARLVIPAWFRKLGPDVEVNAALPWRDNPDWRTFSDCDTPQDWSEQKPEDFRAKPRDVVVTVNGNEYRWPATVTEVTKDIIYIVRDGDAFACQCNRLGPRVHHTRAGAEQQLAAIRAAAGESL